MIGDHKQLRPKLECYELRKESGCQVDFDESLFERLALQDGFPIQVLPPPVMYYYPQHGGLLHWFIVLFFLLHWFIGVSCCIVPHYTLSRSGLK